MESQDKTVGNIAVELVSKGEKENIRKTKRHFRKDEFVRFIVIWFLTFAILFFFLIIITLVKNPTHIFRETIGAIDMINISFSLVLSAFLEQLWSYGKKRKHWSYTFTLCVEGFLTIVGLTLFVAYSILEIVAPTNILLTYMFTFNMAYVLVSSCAVVIGFLSRSLL